MIVLCKNNIVEEENYSLLGKKLESTFHEYDLTVGKEYQLEFSSYNAYTDPETHFAHILGDKGFFRIKQSKLKDLYEILDQLFESSR